MSNKLELQSNNLDLQATETPDTYFTVDCARWYGHRVADCYGGIIYAFRQFDPNYTDRTVNMLPYDCDSVKIKSRLYF